MTIGTWEPGGPAQDPPFEVQRSLLLRFIDLSRTQAWNQIHQLLSSEELQRQSRLMRLGRQRWSAIAADFDNDQLQHLVRFFTLAEMQLPGWEAGAESPVVWLVKVLRQRKCPPDRELLMWIKHNSDNKFLPNGALS